MKKFTITFLIITSLLTSAFKISEEKQEQLKIKEDDITCQPYKVELIDDKTSQSQNTLSLKVANDVHILTAKTGDKILFTLPSDVNLESGAKIPSGTKFSATIVFKEGRKIKIIINEIIFTDTKNYIILSNPKKIAPLKTICAKRILGKYATVTGTFRLGTVISAVNFSQTDIKAEPDTTTAVGICILIRAGARILKAGTPVNITFENNIKPEIGLLK
ncbi:hypothetical protein IJ707_03195 [bacterium]|nr:hypothetical protein [bacterium]